MNIGKTRNPVVSLLIAAIGGSILPFIPIIQIWIMLGELKAYTGDESIAQWKIFIPILNIIFFWSTVPAAMAAAKQKAGVQKPAMGGFMYLILAPYALAADLNDVWDGAKRLPAAG